MIPWLRGPDDALPDTRRALPSGSEAPGLLAAGGELTPQRLRDGLVHGDTIALCSAPSVAQAVVILGALRAGVVVAPLAPGSTPTSLARMLADAQARRLFVDAGTSISRSTR